MKGSRLLVIVLVLAMVIAATTGVYASGWQQARRITFDGTTYYAYFTPQAERLASPGWQITWRLLVGRPIPVPEPPAPVPQPPAPVPEPPAPDMPTGEAAMEVNMLSMVNGERTAAGAGALTMHEGLRRLARLKSHDMINLGYFAHQSPTYGSPFDMIRSAGISYRTAGENLAGAPTLNQAHRGLMNSPGHRRNILNPAFNQVGIGVVRGGPYGYMFTQMFIGAR